MLLSHMQGSESVRCRGARVGAQATWGCASAPPAAATGAADTATCRCSSSPNCKQQQQQQQHSEEQDLCAVMSKMFDWCPTGQGQR